MTRDDSTRLYGSVRILRDGRVRFSPWTFPVLNYLSFMVMNDDLFEVLIQGQWMMQLDLSRGRIYSANFRYSLTPDELRKLVSVLRRAGHGLERWIVPALEYTSLSSAFREEHPETYAIVPELLESCRDLPVADHWKKIRAAMFAKYEKARAEAAEKKAAPARTARRKTPLRQRQGKARRTRPPR